MRDFPKGKGNRGLISLASSSATGVRRADIGSGQAETDLETENSRLRKAIADLTREASDLRVDLTEALVERG
jgi:hypothetical protein